MPVCLRVPFGRPLRELFFRDRGRDYESFPFAKSFRILSASTFASLK